MMMAGVSGSAHASVSSGSPDFSADSLSVSVSTGMLGGKAGEMVYDPDTGHKISQLSWKIKNVAIIKGDISWDAYSFLTLNARGWTSLAAGSGHLDDYDWLNSNQGHWTDHSSSPHTPVNYANEYDLNLKGWFLQGDNYRVGAVAGYQESRFSWTAFGGSYNYDNGTLVGESPHDERGIGYSQRFSVPYVGLTGHYRINDFEFGALFKFSDWVRARGSDEHYLRHLNVRGKASSSRYYGASVDAGYYVTPHAKVFAEFAYSKFEEGKGGGQAFDGDQTVTRGGDAIGIANHNYTVTAGLQYRF